MSERAQHYRTVGKNDLTARQREVLQLIAAGKTNPEIAERLGISLDGAKFHVRGILAKLEVESREEAAEWWRESRGLGRRVASWLRGLAPAAWLKPVAIGSAVGGTTLGVVAVGFAMNGGNSGTNASVDPACDTATLAWTTRSVMDSDPKIGLRYVMSASAPAECVLNAVVGVSGYGATQSPSGGTFSFGLGGPIAVTIEKQLLGVGETPLIVGRVFNVCNSGEQMLLAITTQSQGSYFLDEPLPPCTDPVAAAGFTAQWSANVSAITSRQATPATPWWTQPRPATVVPGPGTTASP